MFARAARRAVSARLTSAVPRRHLQLNETTTTRLLRYRWVSAGILLAPAVLIGAYGAVRLTRIEDEDASTLRHGFDAEDGATELPKSDASVERLFQWRGDPNRSVASLVLHSAIRCTYLSMLFVPLALFSPMLWFDSTRVAWWHWTRAALVQAGPCFVKFGQWAAARPDLFSDEVCAELSALHDRVPAHSAAVTRATVEAAFGRRIDEIFTAFDDEPIASGAVAQVHRARTLDGREVAVKVLHPNIADRIESDMRLLHALASLVQMLPRMEFLALRESVEQFATTMVAQIDLRYEARNMRRFARNFANDQRIRFARPLTPSLCHSSVLVQSFERGYPLKMFLPSTGGGGVQHHASAEQRKVIAHAGAAAFLRMMLIHNFVHADLHPGNILVETPSTSEADVRLVFLDCGLVSQLSDRDNENFIALFTALCDGDAEHGAQLMIERARFIDEQMRVDGGESALARRREFVHAMSSSLGKLKNQRLSEIRVGEVMQDVFSISRHYGVQVDPVFATLVVGTAVIEGVARQLDPEISLIDVAGPVLLRRHALMARERVSGWLRDDAWLQ
jgi:aarF domain-containing kinase